MRQVAVLLGVALVCSAAGIEKIDVFSGGEGGYASYRIPGLVVTGKGTVLAYCEARKGNRGDWGTIDLYLRRSTDGGRTWDTARRIAEVPGPHSKNPVAVAQKLAVEGEVTYNNPVAIADSRRGTVHFVFNIEYARAFYMRSDDDGRTFTKPVEITSTFEQFRKDYDWKVLATGPGHGIQLKSGRLVVPVWLSTGTGGHAHRPSVVASIYSDDHGSTWQRGDIAIPNTEEWVNPNETAAVELADGRVMFNARNESNANRRLITYSRDGSGKWSKPVFHEQLLEPICMGTMVRHGKRVLFANPDNLFRADGKEAPGKPRDRRNVSIKVSRDNGKSWSAALMVEEGPSGYSDLAVLRDGTTLLLYERSRSLVLARIGSKELE